MLDHQDQITSVSSHWSRIQSAKGHFFCRSQSKLAGTPPSPIQLSLSALVGRAFPMPCLLASHLSFSQTLAQIASFHLPGRWVWYNSYG